MKWFRKTEFGAKYWVWNLSILVVPSWIYTFVILLTLLASGLSPKPTDTTYDGYRLPTHDGVFQERLKIFDVSKPFYWRF